MWRKSLIVVFVYVAMLSAAYSIFINTKLERELEINITPKPFISPTKATASPTPLPTPKPLPSQYQISGGTQVFQTFNNCGPASLSMALSFYEIFATQKELGDELRPWQNQAGIDDDKSVTLTELSRKAEDFGLIAYHRPNGDIATLKSFIVNDIPVITRTLTKINEDIGHYRVIYGYNDTLGEIIQNDSLQGKALTFKYDEFLALWKTFNFEYLVLLPTSKQNLAQKILKDNLDYEASWQNAIKRLNNEEVKSLDVRFSLAVAYYNVGDYEKSIEAFESVEPELPFRTLWYQIEPLLAYQKLKRYDDLLSRIERILENGNRAYSELYQIRGEIYQDQGDAIKAQTEFEKALFYNKNYSQDLLR